MKREKRDERGKLQSNQRVFTTGWQLSGDQSAGGKGRRGLQAEERAWQAAEEYGVRERVAQVTGLHLGGILRVVWDDVGDIYLDGVGAKRLVTACQRRGIKVKGKAKRGLKGQVVGPIYSRRAIVGDGPEYMF